MHSIKTTVTAAAVLTAGFALAAPAAHAATAPRADSGCRSAISHAKEAKHDYDSAASNLKQEAAGGGHPGTAEEQDLSDRLDKAKTAVWDAMEACKGMHERRHHRHPHGAMHTGVGSTSRGVNGGELAGGVGMLGAVGTGALVLRRRRRGTAGEGGGS